MTPTDILILISWILPMVLVVWVYVYISNFEAILEQSDRNQRVCGSHVFEKERPRYVAYLLSKQDTSSFRWMVIILFLITSCVCLGHAMIREEDPMLRFYMVSIATTSIGLMFVLWSFLRKNFHSTVFTDYENALIKIQGMFRVLYEHTKIRTIGSWERFKRVLAKRVAIDHNLTSIAEAEDRVSFMLANNIEMLIGYIEFDIERDHAALQELVLLMDPSDQPATTTFLETLGSIEGYNPMPAYKDKLKTLYIVLTFFVVASSFAWLHKLRTELSLLSLTYVFLAALFLCIMYSNFT